MAIYDANKNSSKSGTTLAYKKKTLTIIAVSVCFYVLCQF